MLVGQPVGSMKPVTVLTINGGGMRGLYATYVLHTLAECFATRREVNGLDLGKGFDLVVGTSTGAILTAGIAAGIPLKRIMALYKEAGPQIFKDPVPPYDKSLRLSRRISFYHWLWRHRRRAGNSNERLESALRDTFGELTFGELYERRGIGVCVPATSYLHHTPRIFKTPHIPDKQRDNDVLLADACLASSAAPIYLPLASIKADGLEDQIYADGGLWANNPVLIGLLEALAVSAPRQPVVILSVGTCPPPSGTLPPENLDQGVAEWRSGIRVMELAMNVQVYAACNAVLRLVDQLNRLKKRVHILRCEESIPSSKQAELLQLDSASQDALDLMKRLGNKDGHDTFRWCQKPVGEDGKLLDDIFDRMPAYEVS